MIKLIQQQYVSKLTQLVTRLLRYAEDLLPLDAVELDESEFGALAEEFLDDIVPTQPVLEIEQIENRFISELNHLFIMLSPHSAERAEGQALHFAELSILQDDELEENIVIETMAAKVTVKSEIHIKQLTQRLASVLNSDTVNKDLNPFRPHNICKSFQVAVTKTNLTLKQRIYLYERFEAVVLSELEEIYKNINEQMKSAGILTELSENAKITHSKSIERPRYDDNHYRLDHVDEETELLTALKGLMRQSAATNQTNHQASPELKINSIASNNQKPVLRAAIDESEEQNLSAPVDQQTLIEALNEVQQMHNEFDSLREAQMRVTKVKKQLTHTIQTTASESNRAIGVDNENMIDIVSMIFDFIFDDQNLPDEFKALLGRLQIPILKVALLDSTFMNSPQHPARVLINQLAQACVGWSEDQGIGLRDKVTDIVNRLINEFDQDVQLFEELLEDFVAYNKMHNHRVALLEKRLKETEEGKALQEKALSQASAAIQKIKSGHILPDSIDRFLDEDWHHLMTLSFLREGRSSQMWQQYLTTGSALVKSLYPISSQSDRAIHKLKAAELVTDLKKGLDLLGQDDYQSRGLFADLSKLHDSVRDGQQVISKAPLDNSEELAGTGLQAQQLSSLIEELPVDADIEEIELTAVAESSEEAGPLDEYRSQVASFQAGIWFTIQDGDLLSRCKLAAVISPVGKYIFVNNTGRKVAEYSKNELIIALRDKVLLQLDDGELFERALKKIVTNFKERQYQTDKEWQ